MSMYWRRIQTYDYVDEYPDDEYPEDEYPDIEYTDVVSSDGTIQYFAYDPSQEIDFEIENEDSDETILVEVPSSDDISFGELSPPPRPVSWEEIMGDLSDDSHSQETIQPPKRGEQALLLLLSKSERESIPGDLAEE